MRWPWISRSAHDAIVTLLTTQVDVLTQERRLLLDRLAALGLGGPLFSVPAAEDSVEEEAATDPEADEIQRLKKSRRRPSKLADALTRKAYRDYNRIQTGPSVQWIAKALDEAEAAGKEGSPIRV
jgi:hypothetical protein